MKTRQSKKVKRAATLRTCAYGHQYHKTGDCPTCPLCEEELKPKEGFLSALPAPARRALENHGITSLQQLTRYREEEILALHGMGKTSLPKLRSALNSAGFSFRK